jgi:hypothetical protein
MKTKSICFIIILLALNSVCFAGKIDRKAVVQRHNITIHENNPKKPMQVGNGEFGYNVDITGMQTFFAHNTMAHWAWHSMPLPDGLKLEDFEGQTYTVNGRPVKFDIDNLQQPELSKWLAANPQPVNLGRIGLYLTHADGSMADVSEIKNATQTLDLWTGIITSSFVFDSCKVMVKTACHQKTDELGFEINSSLISKGRLKIAVEFPYADDREGADFIGDYNSIQKHSTVIKENGQCLLVERKMDDFNYFVSITSQSPIKYDQAESINNPHKLLIMPESDNSQFNFTFSKDSKKEELFEDVFTASAQGWKEYWLSGAAIDFSKCTDLRAFELERRVVLSQYHMKVNNSGSLPPPESGFLKNNWHGKFHFEMIWWHGAHFAFWNRWSELDKMLNVYQKFLPTSIERAKNQEYSGARWPKATGNIDREWPHVIHALLIWQQPHPIYFAEMDYRLHPNKQTLDKWKDVVFATADFLASYPVLDSISGYYNLNPPLFIMSENTDHNTTKNPAFELSYWRFGLRTAIEWRKKLNLLDLNSWNSVLKNLAPLPVEDNKYVTYEGIKDMWTKYNFEHPGLIATYGMLPGDGVDTAIMRNTFDQVIKTWNFDRTWGWDFPVFAMTAARLNLPEKAVDMLLFPSKQFSFDVMGYNSWVYFPGNGGLLSAIAMMAGGWDGCPNTYAPGFPKNGKWNVKIEGFKKMP